MTTIATTAATTGMDELRECAVYLGAWPMPGESKAEFGDRLLAVIADRMELYNVGLRVRILAALNREE